VIGQAFNSELPLSQGLCVHSVGLTCVVAGARLPGRLAECSSKQHRAVSGGSLETLAVAAAPARQWAQQLLRACQNLPAAERVLTHMPGSDSLLGSLFFEPGPGKAVAGALVPGGPQAHTIQYWCSTCTAQCV
jgi:hypothetical protein